MKKEEFDDLFDRVFDETVQGHHFTPDPSNSWNQLQKQLAKKKRRRLQLRVLPYIAASFLLGAFIFGTPTASNAFQPLFQAVITIKDDVVRIVFGNPGTGSVRPKTPPPPEGTISSGNNKQPAENNANTSINADSGAISSEKFETWEQASKIVNFKPPVITYTIDGFTLDHVTVSYPLPNKTPDDATIIYSNVDGYAYTVSFQKLLKDMQVQSSFNTSPSEGIKVSLMKVKHHDLYVMTSDDGRSGIEFIIDDLYINLIGVVTSEELIKVAEDIIDGSMKK